MALINVSPNAMLAETTSVASTFWRRLKGLLGTRELPAGEALLIVPCNSVHTFGMKYPIDVIFVGKDNRVLKTVGAMQPGKIAACFGASYVVELPAGTLDRTGTCIGDILEYR